MLLEQYLGRTLSLPLVVLLCRTFKLPSSILSNYSARREEATCFFSQFSLCILVVVQQKRERVEPLVGALTFPPGIQTTNKVSSQRLLMILKLWWLDSFKLSLSDLPRDNAVVLLGKCGLPSSHRDDTDTIQYHALQYPLYCNKFLIYFPFCYKILYTFLQIEQILAFLQRCVHVR